MMHVTIFKRGNIYSASVFSDRDNRLFPMRYVHTYISIKSYRSKTRQFDIGIN